MTVPPRIFNMGQAITPREVRRVKLNPEIVFDNLKTFIPAEMHGPADRELCLERPEFYSGDEKTFLSRHLYVAKADRLPPKPTIEKGAVVVCVGESFHLAYYRQRCCVIEVKGNDNLLSAFNLVQGIFNKYDAWNERLWEILNTTASVKEMVEGSLPIFENPIFAIDANFHFLAYVGYTDMPDDEFTATTPDDNNNLRLPVLAQFLELREPSMYERKPLLLNLKGSSTLNINLFRNENYIGCVTIDYRLREHRPSDIPLAQHLAKMITASLQKHSTVAANGIGVLRQTLQDVVEGLPAGTDRRAALETANLNKEYVCVKMRFSSRIAQLPFGYICNMLESSFPKSVSFEYDSSVVGFISTEAVRRGDGTYKDNLRDMLNAFIQSIDAQVGVSDPFCKLYSAGLYYKQASSALESGNLIHPAERYYTFQEYVLMEMVINSLGEFPADMLYSEGMRRLAEHDAHSQVSYLETLRTYLDRNMSIAKTAAALFVHRSTLLERLARIERELETDLKDPDERLRLQILLRANKIHEMIRGKANDRIR